MMAKLNMTKEESYLLEKSVSRMDMHYDEEFGLLREADMGLCSRESAYYALGLLIRQNSGDIERAVKIIDSVLDMQFDCIDEVFHGTFKTWTNRENPPLNAMPIDKFPSGWYEYLDFTFENIGIQLKKLLPQQSDIEQYLQKAIARALPIVWDTYDPNWREFIGCCFALALEEFSDILPERIIKRLDSAMEKTTEGSVKRRKDNEIPMNTNVEIMHIFLANYYGHRFGRNEWIEHSLAILDKFYSDYCKNHSVAEFNSPTYCGVDVIAFGMWKKYGKSEELRIKGGELEFALWEDLALFYNANLKRQCGPYSRNYDMKLFSHTSMGALAYLTFGEEGYKSVVDSTEIGSDPMIILLGCRIPEKLRQHYATFQGKRLVTKQFNELIERGKKNERNPLCTVTAWIEDYFMMGAIAGSRNTSGQLHPATVFWGDSSGKAGSIRMLRREPGGRFGAHYRTVFFNGAVDENEMIIDINFELEREIELFFEIEYEDELDANIIEENKWNLPGLTLCVDSTSKICRVDKTRNGLEVVYLYKPENPESKNMNFKIKRA